MAIFLPIAVFLILWRVSRLKGDSTREASLRAAVLSAALLIFITELLSAFYLVTRTGLVCAWLAVLVAAIGLLVRVKRNFPANPAAVQHSRLHFPRNIDPVDALLGASILFSFAVIGVIAIVAPPDTWDVMEHHLPRVLFWVSNHTLRVFPTPDYTQIMQGTCAESITLHTYLLWGSDRLANMVEFLSLAGSVFAVTLVAARLGANRTGQLCAAIFVVTLPEALLESSGSMSTGVATFWIATMCLFLLRAGESLNRWDVITAALAAGLAWLTKGITAVYLPLLILCCVLFRPPSIRLWFLNRLPIFLALIFLINAGQFFRAWQVTGTPLDEPFTAGGPRVAFRAERITPTAIAANVLRQVTLQMGTPSTKLNMRIETLVRRMISGLGEDPDDPRASWSSFPFYIDHPTRLETQAGNPVHFALIVVCFCLMPFLSIKLKDKRLLWLIGSIICSFIVFSAFIRWQPWGSRFHLPLLILSAAVVGFTVERLFRRRWQVLCFALLLLLVALPYLLSNSIRSIIPTKDFPTIFQDRASLYFGDQHTAQAPVVLAMADAIRRSGCGGIALDAYLPIPEPQIRMSPPSFYIYPLLAELGIDGRTHFVHYIHVQNSTKEFLSKSSAPPDCAVICLSCKLSDRKKSDAAMGEMHLFGDNELVFPRR